LIKSISFVDMLEICWILELDFELFSFLGSIGIKSLEFFVSSRENSITESPSTDLVLIVLKRQKIYSSSMKISKFLLVYHNHLKYFVQ
jgi:hypothetical protein